MQLLCAFLFFQGASAHAAVSWDVLASIPVAGWNEVDLDNRSSAMRPGWPSLAGGLTADLGLTRNHKDFLTFTLGGEQHRVAWTAEDGSADAVVDTTLAWGLLGWRHAFGSLDPTQEPTSTQRLTLFTDLGVGVAGAFYQGDFIIIPEVYPAGNVGAGLGGVLGKGRLRGVGELRGELRGGGFGTLTLVDCVGIGECISSKLSANGGGLSLNVGLIGL
jgi:hypothetical protein